MALFGTLTEPGLSSQQRIDVLRESLEHALSCAKKYNGELLRLIEAGVSCELPDGREPTFSEFLAYQTRSSADMYFQMVSDIRAAIDDEVRRRTPSWNSATGKVFVGERMVATVARQAKRKRAILDAFHPNWPDRIQSPLINDAQYHAVKDLNKTLRPLQFRSVLSGMIEHFVQELSD